MGIFFNYNGKILSQDTTVVGVSNRGLRYGDGIFETMRVKNNSIQFRDLHFQRLFHGLSVLKFSIPSHFTPLMLETQILELCKKNGLGSDVRVRLMIFRSNGGLYDPKDLRPNYTIETFPLAPSDSLNSNGLVIGICPGIEKSCDSLSNLKSNNFLSYVMAATWAKEQKFNDALLMNTRGGICDSTIANIFTIVKGNIYTPPLSEGCVAGVMRAWLINHLSTIGYKVIEEPINIDALQASDEVFLTNAIKGIRWVKECGNSTYQNHLIKQIYASLPPTF